MKKWLVYLCFIVVVLPLGCGTIKKIVGWDKDPAPSKENPSKKIIVPPSEPIKITSTTLSNLALYSLVTLIVLFAIRYGLKKYDNK